MNQILSNQKDIQSNSQNKIQNTSSRSSSSSFKIIF